MKIFKLILLIFSIGFSNQALAQNGSQNSNIKEEKQKTTPEIYIAGQRELVYGKPGIVVNGTTIGLEEGTTLIPYFKFPGLTQYSPGTARLQIDKKGEFSWKRRTPKKIYIYFATEDKKTISNRIIIKAK